MFLKAFTKIIVVSGIFAECTSAKVDGIERGGKKSSGVEIDENGPRFLGFDAIPPENLEMKRHLKGKANKANKQCNLKNRSFIPYLVNIDIGGPKEMCARVCPESLDEFIVPGTVPSKSAEECCAEYPDYSQLGYCFSIDQLCLEDTKVCEAKEVFYHYNFFEDRGQGYYQGQGCVRGCDTLPYFYYNFDFLPTTTKGYTTEKDCCAENSCAGGALDTCQFSGSESTSTTQSTFSSTFSSTSFGSKLSFEAGGFEGMSFAYSLSY